MYISYPHISTYIYIYIYNIYRHRSTFIFCQLVHSSGLSSEATNNLAPRLLEAGAKKDPRHSSGATPLHYAAQNGCSEAATLLLDVGAEGDAARTDGFTPLHVASLHGRLEPHLHWSKKCKEHICFAHLCTMFLFPCVPAIRCLRVSLKSDEMGISGNLREIFSDLLGRGTFADGAWCQQRPGDGRRRLPRPPGSTPGAFGRAAFLIGAGRTARCARRPCVPGPVCNGTGPMWAQCGPTLGPNVRNFWPNSSWETCTVCTVCTVSLSNVFGDSLCTNLLSLMHLRRLAPMNVVCSFS